MAIQLSPDLQISLTVAISEAGRRLHEYAGLEHMLYALLLDDETATVLRHAGADIARLRRRLDRYLDQAFEVAVDADIREPQPSLAFQRVIARAGAQLEGTGKDVLRGSDLLVALYAEPDCHAVRILEEEGVTRFDVVRYLAHGASKLQPSIPGARRGGGGARHAQPAGAEDEEEAEDQLAGGALESFTQDLTAQAEAGILDPLVGRTRELARTLHILQRRRKNNPIYVGDPGVGKTALMAGLALRIAEGKVPEPFRAVRVLCLDLGALLAGTRYRGDFEDRVKAVLGELAELDKPILCIDEIHTVIGAGSAGRGTMDASSLLKPALESGRLRCIGATTWEEFRQTFQRDQALARRFQKVEMVEPSVDETVRIFVGLKERYEAHHGIAYTKQAIRAAADLASRYLRDRRLPDKAIDLLDEAGAAMALAGRRRVGVAELERVLATMAQIPERRVLGDERSRLRGLAGELKKVVFGQDRAIDRLVAQIKVARAGLREGDKPVGSFLLTGPTGVGKTEAARRLAEIMGVTYLRFDMSEYMERHSVSRLVGAPPGYVGFDRGGLLTEAVSKHPHTVLLLDEIEKAHPDVFNILLQVMDHGTLTDTNGKQTDFRHVILLMTSNVGAREMAQRAPGFATAGKMRADGGKHEAEAERAVERMFSPEFRNRLDARLVFQPLTPAVMADIVDKFIDEMRVQLRQRKVEVELTAAARELLGEKGHDPVFGARPLGRVIDLEIKRPLTEELLFGALENGGMIRIDGVAGEIVLEFRANT